MIWKIYIVILIYFLLGSIGFFFINRRKTNDESRRSWTKFIVYFFIIHILFFSIVLNPMVFRLLAIVITGGSIYEMTRVYLKSSNHKKSFFLFSLIILLVFAMGFYMFSGLNSGFILFAFLVLSIFDSFSQISGQLWGRRKLFPGISPNKTIEGLTGGGLVALISSIFLRKLIGISASGAFFLTAGIIVFAFIGDMLTSYFKRRYRVKDFSNLIPGHGGFLDRFDSLIAAGAFVAVNEYIINI